MISSDDDGNDSGADPTGGGEARAQAHAGRGEPADADPATTAMASEAADTWRRELDAGESIPEALDDGNIQFMNDQVRGRSRRSPG